MQVIVHNGEIDEKEKQAYMTHAREKYPEKNIEKLDVYLDGDMVDLKYTFADTPFERIRRITGYLVGTLDRFNDAKRAEVEDRVKHTI